LANNPELLFAAAEGEKLDAENAQLRAEIDRLKTELGYTGEMFTPTPSVALPNGIFFTWFYLFQ
jgi:hypothetical protein